MVHSLLLNKRNEARMKIEMESELQDAVIEASEMVDEEESAKCETVKLYDGTEIAMTSYLKEKVDSVVTQMEKHAFGHFAIEGPPSSGKMTIVRLALNQIQTACHLSASPNS